MRRLNRSFMTLAGILATLTFPSLPADAQVSNKALPFNTDAVTKALGRSGKVMPGGVYRVALPRTDLHVTLHGIPLAPAFALGGYAVYKAEPNGTLVLGDLPLLQSELAPVEKSLTKNGFHITALHNHLVDETPRIMFLHYMKLGDAAEESTGLRRALALTGIPAHASPAAPPATIPHREVIERILGRAGTGSGTILSFSFPRTETITVQGMEIPPSMGVATALNFQPVGADRVATTGDFVLTADEVPAVDATLKAHGILTTALHHHMLGDMPPLYYMHFFGVDTPENISEALRDALTHVHLKPQ